MEAQSQLKMQMINSIQRETNPTIRKKICECVSEFARNLLGKTGHINGNIVSLNNSYEIEDEDGSNQWPEFVKFLFECTLSSNVDMKESALIIFRWDIHFLTTLQAFDVWWSIPAFEVHGHFYW